MQTLIVGTGSHARLASFHLTVARATTSLAASVITAVTSNDVSSANSGMLHLHSAVSVPRAFLTYSIDKLVTIPRTPGGTVISMAVPLVISARFASAIAWIDARWFRTPRRSRIVQRAYPGASSSTRAPMDPVYGAIRPMSRLKSALPPGSGASRLYQRAIVPPGASSDFTMRPRMYGHTRCAASRLDGTPSASFGRHESEG